MSLNHACHICDGDYRWTIHREDGVISWACGQHLAEVCKDLQRGWENTRLTVVEFRPRVGGPLR